MVLHLSLMQIIRDACFCLFNFFLICFYLCQVGQHVTVMIPKKDRHSSDIKRLPAVIVCKSTGQQPTYKLLCSAGIIGRRFTASKLMPFPGFIRTGDPEKIVSLSRAAKYLHMANAVYCRCKKTCTSRQCKCFLSKIKCSSRCHKVENNICKNKELYSEPTVAVSAKPSCVGTALIKKKHNPFPKFGGTFEFQENSLSFLNTCPVDNWFAMLKVLLINCPSFLLQKKQFPKNFAQLIELVNKEDYSTAKFAVAVHNGILPKNNGLNFYRSEYTQMIEVYLLPFLRHSIESYCDSPFCPEKHLNKILENIPTVTFAPNTTETTVFENQVNDWFTTSSKTMWSSCN